MEEVNSMTLQFNVNNQTLAKTSNEKVVEYSVNYLYAQFTFNSNWDSVDKKYLIVKKDDMTNRVQLDNENKALIPSAFITSGTIALALVGIDENDYVVITTNPVYFPIYKTLMPYANDPFVKYVESTDDTINVSQSGDRVDLSLPNIYFKDANLTNDILSFLGRDNELLKSINLPYGLLNNITLSLDQTTYTLTLIGLDKNNNVLFTRTADFNIETKVFKRIYYDTQTQELVFVTMDDEEIRVPIGDILTGIATQEWVLLQLQNYVQKENGKGLSTNDYTNEDKAKLGGIESQAQKNVQADWNEQDSSKDDFIKNKPIIPTKTSDLTNDSGFIDSSYHDSTKQNVINSNNKLNADLVDDSNSTNKFTNATEKATWNAKQDALSGSTSVDITSNVVSVKQTYIDSQFATESEMNDLIEEVYGSEYTL